MSAYLNQALVFIGASLVLVPLFHRLGFGSVLGYLIAGILVGPSGIGFIKETESIMHFAELGVVLLLFIIGLEIQPKKLWSMKKQLLGLGGLQVVITTLIFFCVGLYFNFNPLTVAVMAFALSLSSTAFALQSLTEKNQFNTEFGQSSFSILLMQDLLAIPALAIIPALGATGHSEGLGPVGMAIFIPSFLIVAILVNRFLLRPLFSLVASTRAREIFTQATLFIVLGVAAIMLKVGLSAALGTFIAGVLLADSEYRHELEANLDPFKSLLMGLFFISVGMSVRLDLIIQNPILVLALTIGYMGLKFGIIYGIGRMFKLNHGNAKQMGLAISQGGEFAFVIFGIVLSAGLVEESLINYLTVIVTLSMAFSPLINFINDRYLRFSNRSTPEPVYDTVKDESPEVIIAGFGRFGQIFGRVLRTQGIPFIAVDHDANQIELIRKFGNKVYYGDITHLDFLESAGAKRAKYVVLAVDDVDASLAAAKKIRENFPHIKIFARARNRGHAFDLMELGVSTIKRETFDSSLYFVKDLLVELGYESTRAATLVEKFRQHDELMLQEQFKVRSDDKQFISVSQQASAQLQQVLSEESSMSFIKPN